MKLVCDTDGLIKMNKAGILRTLAQHAEILVGPTVFREAVDAGKARGYSDAFELERIAHQHLQRKQPRARAQADRILRKLKLGNGERETLRLYFSENADAIVSDDRGFLNALEDHDIPYLTPAAILVALAERRVLWPLPQAYEALEKLRIHIRNDQYQAALEDLQDLERSTV